MTAIPANLLSNWQEICDLVAEFCKVPACLVMRGNVDSMEVMARAAGDDDPYVAGEKAPRNHELYCETVIERQAPLEVIDADSDPQWRGNPDTKLGLKSYYGVPVNWPSGENFGTFCILDSQPKTHTSLEKRFIQRFALVVQDHLRLIELSVAKEFEASHDMLTGIFNRRIFFEIGEAQIKTALRANTSMALVILDIDHFKAINDSFGHAVGDRALKSVVDAVQSNLRSGDLLARIGGEEFCVLGAVTEADGPMALAERVRMAVERAGSPSDIAGHKITVSCGVAALQKGDDLSTLLKRADEAMYVAKSSGRNCSSLAPCPQPALAR